MTPTEPATPQDDAARRMSRYERVLKRDPADELAFRRLFELYRERDGNADALQVTLQERTKDDEDDWVARTQLGMLLALKGEVESARAMFEEAAALGQSAAPHRALMRIAERASDFREAYAQGKASLALTKAALEQRQLRRELGALAVRAGALDEARAHFEAVASDRRESSASFAEALMEAGQASQAVAVLRETTGRKGSGGRGDARLLRLLARAMVDSGETDELVTVLRDALGVQGSTASREETIAVALDLLRHAGMLSAVPGLLGRSRSVGALRAVALAYAELGEREAASEAFERWVRAAPRDPEPRQRFAEWLLRLGDVDAALAQYEVLGKRDRPSASVLTAWVGLLVDSGRRAEALALLARLSQRLGRDSQGLRLLVEQYRAMNEDALAAPLLRRLSALDPDAPMLIVELGQQYKDAGDLSRAISTWRRLTEVVTPKARGWGRLGQTLLDADGAAEGSAGAEPLRQEAQAAFEQALRLEPDNPAWVRGLALVLQRRGDFVGAEQRWRRVLDEAGTEEDRREARNQLVALFMTTRRAGTKVSELRRRLSLQPPDLEAGRLLIVLLSRMGPEHRAELSSVLKQMATALPTDVPVHRALARFHMARGDRAAALPVYERLVDLDPLRAEEYLARAVELSLALYDDEAALRFAKLSVRRRPEDASAHRRLGDLYLARQMRSEAASAYRRATQLEPTRMDALLSLSDLELSLGQHEEAKATLAAGLSHARDDADTQAILQRLLAVHVSTGDFRGLESQLLPVAVAGTRRGHFRKTLVELYFAWVMQMPAGLSQAAVPPLLQALLDDDPSQRQTALSILERARGLQVQQALLAFAESDAPVRERGRALQVLGQRVRVQDISVLARLAQGGNRRLRPLAVQALGRAPEDTALPALEALLAIADGASREVRSMAFVAAGPLLRIARERSRGLFERALGVLTSAFDEETTPSGRAAAAWALSHVIASDDADERLVALFFSSAGGADWPANEVAARALLRRKPDPVQIPAFLNLALFAEEPAAMPVQYVLGIRASDPLGVLPSDGASEDAMTPPAAARGTTARAGQDMGAFVMGLSRAVTLSPWDLDDADVEVSLLAPLLQDALAGPREQGARVLAALKAGAKRRLFRQVEGALLAPLVSLAHTDGEPLQADALFVLARDYPEALADGERAGEVRPICEGVMARASSVGALAPVLALFQRPWFIERYRGSTWSTRRACALALKQNVEKHVAVVPPATEAAILALVEAFSAEESIALVRKPLADLRATLDGRGGPGAVTPGQGTRPGHDPGDGGQGEPGADRQD